MATHAAKLTREDSLLSWSKSALALHNQVVCCSHAHGYKRPVLVCSVCMFGSQQEPACCRYVPFSLGPAQSSLSA